MLTRRQIGPDDYAVHEDSQLIGRIRLAKDRSPPVWLWNVTVTIPGPSFGGAWCIDQAKRRFKRAWTAFKELAGSEQLAKAYGAMNHANRPDRYR
ncbi:hypothetical protein Q3C01_18120 [Bradyrhizobium sp. UFLA05-109]